MRTIVMVVMTVVNNNITDYETLIGETALSEKDKPPLS